MILLDTFALLSLAAQQENLAPTTQQLIARSTGKIFVSTISALELGTDYRKKLIQLPCAAETWFQKAITLHGLTELPVTSKIAFTATQLPQLHDDLIDRVIIATSIVHNLQIITPNQEIQHYPNIKWSW